jgi:hypothetical protein
MDETPIKAGRAGPGKMKAARLILPGGPAYIVEIMRRPKRISTGEARSRR